MVPQHRQIIISGSGDVVIVVMNRGAIRRRRRRGRECAPVRWAEIEFVCRPAESDRSRAKKRRAPSSSCPLGHVGARTGRLERRGPFLALVVSAQEINLCQIAFVDKTITQQSGVPAPALAQQRGPWPSPPPPDKRTTSGRPSAAGSLLAERRRWGAQAVSAPAGTNSSPAESATAHCGLTP
jgi:hypothetical protein